MSHPASWVAPPPIKMQSIHRVDLPEIRCSRVRDTVTGSFWWNLFSMSHIGSTNDTSPPSTIKQRQKEFFLVLTFSKNKILMWFCLFVDGIIYSSFQRLHRYRTHTVQVSLLLPYGIVIIHDKGGAMLLSNFLLRSIKEKVKQEG